MTGLLEQINSPDDLKKLKPEQLPELCAEMREYIISVVLRNGGHLATNLGVVELTVALHLEYDFTRDRLVFDVGHQCYPHKILTGRREEFATLRTKGGISGYPNPAESPADCFVSGHASTAISLAAGYAEAFHRLGLDRRVVALVGDGSLTGGEAYEGLCYLGATRRDVLVVLNDNRMAISPATGGLTRYLNHLRTSPRYLELKKEIQALLEKLPVFSTQLRKFVEGIHDNLSRMLLESGIFSTLGYKYFGPYDGHDVATLRRALSEVKRLRRPVLLHVLTEKGKGNKSAECDPVSYHGVGPKKPETVKIAEPDTPAFTDVFAETLVELGEKDESICALTAAMPTGTGVIRFMEKFPGRGFDVGIAEGHCVTMAAAMAKGGLKPVVAIYSTFIQRAVDQVFHDVLLQEGPPVFFALDRAGLVGEDGPTHHGLYDIALFRAFPGAVLCAPAGKEEMVRMMSWALESGRTVIMRYPRAPVPDYPEVEAFPDVEEGKGFFVREGKDVALLAYGPMLRTALDAAAILEKEGISCSVADARFARPVDRGMIERAASHPLTVTLEEHSVEGGFGSIVREHLPREARHLILGVPDRFIPHASRLEQLAMCGLDAASVAEAVKREVER